MFLNKNEWKTIICRTSEFEYNCADFLNKLYEVGIRQGDIICVHSQLFNLGTPVVEKSKYLTYLINILKESIGEQGTLIMPTFSYSFCKEEEFSVEYTPSTVGILTEQFRKSENVIRTNHPIFSFALWGKEKEKLLNNSWDAFSKNSVYGKLIDLNGKLIMFGAPKGYTLYYLAEQHVGVNHRYFKYFQGIVNENGNSYNCQVPYYVRDLGKKSSEDEEKVSRFLNEIGLQSQVKIGRGSISCVYCKEMFHACVEQLKKDETYFLKD